MKRDGTDTDNASMQNATSPQEKSVSGERSTPESAPAGTEPTALLARVLERNNIQQALKQIHQRNEEPGIDGMTAAELPAYLKQHWPALRAQLAAGTYRPQPVLRAQMPRPNGKTWLHGVPTMVDRFIQQAIAQVIEAHWAEQAEGFHPEKSKYRVVRELAVQISQNDDWSAQPKIEKFFNHTKHERLLTRLGRRVNDREVLRLVNRFLKVGRKINGEDEDAATGVPHFGPLSHILALVVLEQLHKELERHRENAARRAASQATRPNPLLGLIQKGQQAASQALASLQSRISRRPVATATEQVDEEVNQLALPLGYRVQSVATWMKASVQSLKSYFGIGEASHHRSYLDVTLTLSILFHLSLLLLEFGVPSVKLPDLKTLVEPPPEPPRQYVVQLAPIDVAPVVKPKEEKRPQIVPDKPVTPRKPLTPFVRDEDDFDEAGEHQQRLPGRITMRTRVITLDDKDASDFVLPPLDVRDSKRLAEEQAWREAKEQEAKNKADLIAKQKAAALALKLEEKKRRAEEKAKRLALALEAKRQAELIAKQKAAELALLKLQQEEERKQLALQKLAEEAEKRALEAARLKEEKRLREEEAKRLALEQEAKKQAELLEKQRLAEEQAKRLALELEAKKQAELLEKQKLAEEQAKRLAAELEAKKQAELLAQQKAAELAKLKAQQEEEQRQLALKKQAEDEAARLKEKQRLEEELAKRLAAELEARKQAELLAQQKAAELARLRAQQEEEARQLALKKQAEEEARRAALEAARLKEKQRLEEEQAKRLAAELEARKQAELLAQQKAAEQARIKAQQEEEARQLALKKQAEEEARRAALEAARLKEKQRLEEEQAKRLAAELEAKKQAELLAQQKAAEQARIKAQQEEAARQAALKKQQQEEAELQARLELERKAAQLEKERKYAIELAAKKLAEETARLEREAAQLREAKRLEEERQRRAQEEQARRLEEERLRRLEEERQKRLKEEEEKRLAAERARRLQEEFAKRKQEELERQLERERLNRLERQKEAEEDNLKFLKKNQGKGTWVY